jgi:hypothetical protein
MSVNWNRRSVNVYGKDIFCESTDADMPAQSTDSRQARPQYSQTQEKACRTATTASAKHQAAE